MTALFDLLTTAGMPVVLLLAKVTCVLLVALALTTLLGRASATARHLVWTATILALFALPLLTRFSPVRLAVLPAAWSAAVGETEAPHAVRSARPRPATTVGDVAVPPVTVNVDAGPANVDVASPGISATIPNAFAQLSIGAMLLMVWSAVTLGLLAWLAWGMWSVHRIVRGASALDDAAWQGTMIDIADRLSLDTMPRLLRSSQVTMPFACGLRTPTIVLPSSSDEWSSDRRTAVLLHELAHIRRHDIVGHTLARVACAFYWFHPLVWAAAKQLRAESERACDDLALGCGTRASDYAEHLLDIVTSVRSHGTPNMAMAMATRSEFEGRMLAILDPSLSRRAPTRVQASTLAGGVMMFAIVTGSAVPRVMASPVAPSNAGAASAPTPGEPQHATPQSATAIDSSASTVTVAAQSQRLAVSPTRLGTMRTDTTPMPRPMPMPTPMPMPVPRPTPTTGASAASARLSAADSSARAAALVRVLRSDTAASLRRTAAWGLQDYTDNDAVLDALLAAARKDASASVREMALWALQDAADQGRVMAVLLDAVRHESDKGARSTAVWAVGDGASGTSTDAIDALSSVLTDEDPQLRELAVWGIGNAEPRRAPAAVIKALEDRDAHVRATAAWALFKIGDGDAAGPLEIALNKEMDPQAKWAMVRAIAVMGDRAVTPLQRMIESGDAKTRALAIRSLAGRGHDPWPQPRPRPRPSLIEDGVLHHWLLDARTALRLGLTTNGRAIRGLSGPPAPAPSNLYLQAGPDSPEALIGEIESGFYVTETSGMGVNLVTGDYSQGAAGIWIEKGTLTYAVSGVTIAGKLADMFANFTPANDLRFESRVNAPTLGVGRLTVAGGQA